MKRIFLVVGIITAIALLSGGCYYDSEENLYPPGGCDTSNVRFSVEITSILSTKCYQCHSNNTAPTQGDGIVWEGYANVIANLDSPGEEPTFIASINHDIGATPMPKNNPKLSACDIRKLEIWIANGKPNN